VFAIAFVQYLQFFLPLDFFQQLVVKAVFLFTLTYINIRGVKAAGRVNDVLTIIKLAPLLLLVVVGYFIVHPGAFASNYLPFAPLGIRGRSGF